MDILRGGGVLVSDKLETGFANQAPDEVVSVQVPHLDDTYS